MEIWREVLQETCTVWGPSRLRCGVDVDYYFDVRQLWLKPILLGRVCRAMAEAALDLGGYGGYDCVVATPVSGVPFATQIARELNLPLYVGRKAKAYHTRSPLVRKDARVLLVDDVITTGQSCGFAAEYAGVDFMRAAGMVCVLDRRAESGMDVLEGVPSRSILTGPLEKGLVRNAAT